MGGHEAPSGRPRDDGAHPPGDRGLAAVGGLLARGVQQAVASVEHLAGGLSTALLALCVLAIVVMVALTCVVGVGLLVLPATLRMVRSVADRERSRLSRWGPEVISPYPASPTGLRTQLLDPATRRDLAWLTGHATLGLLLGILGVLLPVMVVRDLSVPLWWWLAPTGKATPAISFVSVVSWPGAFAVSLLGLAWIAIAAGAGPGMARAQAGLGRLLLVPHPGMDLSMRIATLTATRAAALDAHSAELRRIERSLHDGTQNRLVGTTVLIGAARRALQRDPVNADEILERAQTAAEQALAELRGVARGILPPVLADRGLDGALDALAAACSVDCQVEVDVPGRCAASVEATAYFVVAEALTNIAKHSGAEHASVTLRRNGDRLLIHVADNGHGGADAQAGSGIDGIRRRIEAYDGTFTLASPAGGPTVLEVELPCGS